MKHQAEEIQEALEAGYRALSSLGSAESELYTAHNWGFFDILGGGFFSGMMKHSHLQRASECIRRAQEDLDAFQRELADVRLPRVEIGSLMTFADFFFDGFWTDLMVQSRIDQARERLREATERVEDILDQLEEL